MNETIRQVYLKKKTDSREFKLFKRSTKQIH